MILAAGEGLRLRPLTAATPKALVDLGGVSLLERAARRLVRAGADRIIVNAHYLAPRIAEWARQTRVGAEVVVSREDGVSASPLDTGGGLLHARPLFEAKAPFFLHNADVATDLDLAAVYRAHAEGEARDGRLATLVVMGRATERPLLTDRNGVYGRANRKEGWEHAARAPASGETGIRAFCGIHVLSERALGLLAGAAPEPEPGPSAAAGGRRSREAGPPRAFSIVDAYMRWIGEGERIELFDMSGGVWHDIGTAERLAEARRAFADEERPT